MKKFKEFVVAILILGALGFFIYYLLQSTNQNRALARSIAELSPRGGPPETIEGLEKAIELYREQHERNIREAAQTGVYWKILATRYMDRNMHNNALEAIEWAVYYNGGDPYLFFIRGISAAEVARNVSGFSNSAVIEKERYYSMAETAFKRALELDITYTKAMFELALMYVLDLNRSSDAIDYLERFLQLLPSDINAMMVLARAYYLTENFSRAIEMYDRIASRTNDRQLKEDALNNKYFIQGILNEY